MKNLELLRIDVPNAPDIPCLRFRGYLGEVDIPEIVKITNIANRADNIKEYEVVEDVIAQYRNLRNIDMDKDIFIAEVRGKMVGFGQTSWKELEYENTFTYQNFFIVHPDWRGKGIGKSIQPVLEARSLEVSRQHREAADKYMESTSNETQTNKTKLLKQFDYSPVRYFFEMKRDLKLPIANAQIPAGLNIRPVTEDHFPAIHAGWYEAFQGHWAYIAAKEGDLERWIEEVTTIPAYNPERWVVVWDGDDVAGINFNGVHEETNEAFGMNEGWLHTICVRRPWRSRGLASAMIVESLQLFKEWGLDVAVLSVDSSNPSGALGLYERHGFKRSSKMTSWRKQINK